MTSYRVSRVALLIVTALLSACQSIPSTPEADSQLWLRDAGHFKSPLLDHAQLSGWQFNGKVALRSDTLNESANIIWKYADQSNHVRMFGPLGAGAVKLDFDRYGVQLSDSKGLKHRGNSAEQLLSKIVGWPIPIDALNFWLFGLPDPERAYEYQLNEAGQLSALRQMGWTIKYSAHQLYPPHSQSLARKLLAQKNLPNDQVLCVKIVTKAWQW